MKETSSDRTDRHARSLHEQKLARVDQRPDHVAIARVAVSLDLGQRGLPLLGSRFASEDALAKYADSPAQKKWYDAYMAVREESRTSDITN